MKHLAIILAGFAATGSANARSDTDYPHRDWGKVATLDMTVAEATSCVARELGRSADVSVIPAEGGNDIDVAAHVMWGKKMEPWQTYKIRDEAGAVTLRGFYRHPVKMKAVSQEVAKLQARCLKVKSIDQETVANK